jgi:cell division protein FtsW
MRTLSRDGAVRSVPFDPFLLGAALALTSLGLVMVYSASAVTAQEKLGDAFYFLRRQSVAAVLGLVAMVAVLRLGYRRLARLSYPLLLIAVVLLVLVLIPGVGTVVGGARRWIRVAGFGLQPAEVAKLAWIVYLSCSLARKREKVATFSVGFLPYLLSAGVLVALCLRQPDFGSSVALLFLLFVLLFAAGTRLSYLIGSILLAIPVGWHLVSSTPYRLNRFMAFIDPMAHRHDAGYQVVESLMSIGSGGWTGLGLGDGRQKLFFLPEAHNDFIAAIIGEELGLLGIGLVVGLYAVIIWRGLRASLAAPEPFGVYLGLGITSLIGFQAVVNMGVTMALLPTKGLTLPFISYGGSSLMMTLAATGTLLSISVTAEARARASSPSVQRGASRLALGGAEP